MSQIEKHDMMTLHKFMQFERREQMMPSEKFNIPMQASVKCQMARSQ